MWKDFLYFSRGERRAIIALILIILVVQAALWTSNYWIPMLPEELTGINVAQKELNAFQDTLSGHHGFENKSAGGFYDRTNRKYTQSSHPEKLVLFDPNTADSVKLVSLGLRPYIAKNILKYRRKGGVFRQVEDFARIYGITPEQYAKLKPFIRLNAASPSAGAETTFSLSGGANTPHSLYSKLTPAKENTGNNSNTGVSASNQNGMNVSIQHSSPVATSSKLSTMLVMDVNQIDTAMLQQIKGVGSVTANRVTQYRSRLGGFYSVRQLEEVKGIYPDALTRLQSLLKVDTTQIVRINANKASLERLRAHPYLSFYQAKVIVELRKARSGIKSINELADFKEFTKEDINRLKWYLIF